MMIFNFFSPQTLLFGAGKISELPGIASRYGNRLLLVTGKHSFQSTPAFQKLMDAFQDEKIKVSTQTISSEPGPDQIDRITDAFRKKLPHVVVAVGGGSVIDAGKAISAMLLKETSIKRYLEGIGDLAHDGKKIPFIACPTTAGTGSEATKNAVITETGKNGFKKSLRHDRFIPDVALVDPELTVACPPRITAACGMDALTQLIESLASVKATPLTDSLALGALKILGNALPESIDKTEDIDIRSRISYAAYISGLTLANAGLGLVHGFAGTIGGLKAIPHGIVCGTLLAETILANITHLAQEAPGHPAIRKYAQAGKCLTPGLKTNNPLECAGQLCATLQEWTDLLNIPLLNEFDIKEQDIKNFTVNSSQKNNPCRLSLENMEQILRKRL